MTANPARLRNLAERVQRASGRDRQLDLDIACEVGLVADDEALSTAIRKSPRYTASLDAAASLVPAGWHWGVAVRGDEPEATGHVLAPHPDETVIQQKAPTPALALLAAALLAMAHDAEAAR